MTKSGAKKLSGGLEKQFKRMEDRCHSARESLSELKESLGGQFDEVAENCGDLVSDITVEAESVQGAVKLLVETSWKLEDMVDTMVVEGWE